VDRQIPGRPFQQRLARRPGSFHKLIKVRILFDCLGKEILEAYPGFFIDIFSIAITVDFVSDRLAGSAGGRGKEQQPEMVSNGRMSRLLFEILAIVNFVIIPLRYGNS
jgi:hypothetical protein